MDSYSKIHDATKNQAKAFNHEQGKISRNLDTYTDRGIYNALT